jgi:hypothetical protein
MEKVTPRPISWSAVVVQKFNYIIAPTLLDFIQCIYIVVLPLPTSKQPTILGGAFSISEVVYCQLLPYDQNTALKTTDLALQTQKYIWIAIFIYDFNLKVV